MADYICIDVDKLKAALPGLILEISAEGKCGGAPVEPPDPVEPPPTGDKPVKLLTEYLWEDSDQLVPGQAILMPHASFTGQIVRVKVNDEIMVFHSVWSNGREIWFASHNVAYYGNASLEIETETTIYRTKSGTADVPVEGAEKLRYHGRFNGDRPTWYGSKKMSEYPRKLRVIIAGCLDKTITHDGVRYDDGALIVKQSDVPGRGLAVIYSASCKSTEAFLDY